MRPGSSSLIPLAIFILFALSSPETVGKAKSSDKHAAAVLALIKGAGTDPTKPQPIDLRPLLKQMKLRERGLNIIYKAKGHQLLAEVKNRKIINWMAKGPEGNPLPTQVVAEGGVCVVFVSTAFPPPHGYYRIDCADVPLIRPTKETEVSPQR